LNEFFQFSRDPDVEIHLALPEPVAISMAENGAPAAVVLNRLALDFSLGDEKQAAAVNFSFADISWQDDRVSTEYEAGVQLTRGRKLLPELFSAGNIKRDGEGFSAQGDIKSQGWGLSGNWTMEWPAEKMAIFDAGVTLDDLPAMIDGFRQLGWLPVDLALAGGAGKITYHGTYPAGDANLRLNMGDVSGLYAGVAFSGATIDAALVKDKHWYSPAALLFKVATLSPGIPMEGISARLDLLQSETLPSGRWQLQALNGSLLGGTFSVAEPAIIHYPFEDDKIRLQLSKLQLGEVLKLYEDQGLSGHGELGGMLPVILSGEGVQIAAGYLQSVGPGTIAYTMDDASGAVASSHDQLQMTLRLLEDFRYDALAITTEFEPSGQMQLGLQLSGRNPQELDGRQVNFNINVEENLYDLLRVLQLTDDLTEKIERRLDKSKRP
jgi:hypothetical protein